MTILDPTTAEYERAVAAHWGPRDPTIRSFWQSPTVLGEINRRVTGDPEQTPVEYFAQRYCRPPRKRGLSFGCGDAGVEISMLRADVCERMVAIDLSAERLERARLATPPELAERLDLVCANIESWQPPGHFDLVVANGVVHHLERLEEFFDLIDSVLTDDGLLYLDEFVGPSRFQWTDKQLQIINRLLERLSPELRADLVSPEPGPRPPVTRPSLAGLISTDPSEAARSSEIPGLLRERLEMVEERPWGGAIFHQLFNRIMGNFSGQDDLVRALMEFDAILTDEGVVDADYLWGVYRLRPGLERPAPSRQSFEGRLESVEGRVVVGWAASTAEPERRLSVDLYVDHKLVGKGVADLPRADLAHEGIGDGAHAFRLELPSWICDGRQHSVTVVAEAVGLIVPTGTGWGQRNRTLPDGTEFVWVRHDRSTPTLPLARVLAGKDGWAFPCDDGVGTIEQLLGRLTLTGPELGDYRVLLEERAGELEQAGIPYVVAIAPAKASIHPEHLPDSSPSLGPPGLARQLHESLADSEVVCVDLSQPLLAAARAGRQLYYKRDPDWNYEGAMIAATALLASLSELELGVIEPATESVAWIEESFEGSLAGKPAVQLEDGALRPAPASGLHEAARRPDERALGLRRVAAPDALAARDPGAIVVENPDHADATTALILHDPGGRRLLPFLGGCFSRSWWSARQALDSELIGVVDPALVLEILDESLLVQVPYGPSGPEAASRERSR